VVVERDWVPVSPQSLLKPPQLPQLPYWVAPQLLPLVVAREHDCVSVLVDATHCPVAQLYVELVTVLDCVPVSTQASLKVHALHCP